MTRVRRYRLLCFALLALGGLSVEAHADRPDSYGSQSDGSVSGVTIDELNKDFQDLSPAAREALMRQLEQRGVDGLSHMNESDARAAFGGLPPNVRTELQTKWDSMSDEKHEALKKLRPETVKRMVADKIKNSLKPSLEALETMEKAKVTTDKIKEYMKQFWAKLSAKANGDAASQGANDN